MSGAKPKAAAPGLAPFADIHLRWAGEDFTIPADHVMGAIKVVEDHLTLGELQAAASRGKLKLSHIAAAYAELLRYAGAKVTETDVFVGMFDGKAAQANVVGAVAALLNMMIPRNIKLEAAPAGKKPRRVRRAAARSSRRRTN